MKPVRILVTGSRHLNDAGRLFVWNRLAQVIGEVPGARVVLVHGGAAGVDQAVQMMVDTYAGPTVTAEQARYVERGSGRYAGPKRNAHMVSLGADLCLAFPRLASKGTWGCIRLAADVGIPVRIFPLPRMMP